MVNRNLEFFNQLASKLNEIKTKVSPTHADRVSKYAQSWLVDSTKSITDIWGRTKSAQPLASEEKIRRNKERFLANCLAPELQRRRRSGGLGGEEPMETGEQSESSPTRASIEPSSSSSAASMTTDTLGNSKAAFTALSAEAPDVKPANGGGDVSGRRVSSGEERPPAVKAADVSGDSNSTDHCHNGNGGGGGGSEAPGEHADNNGDNRNGGRDGGMDEEDSGDDVYKSENRGLYCVCERSHEFLLDGQTRMCDACNAWYHLDCVLPYTPESQAKAWAGHRRETAADNDQENLFICPV